MSRLPLNALHVLIAVQQTGSMARAAELLHVQPSAVSMQIKNLSDYLGLPLVAKVGRQIKLSTHALQLLSNIALPLEQIESALETMKLQASDHPFTLSVLPSFLYRWLLPRLQIFEAAHPHIQLRILTSRELIDFSKGEADAAVRLGNGNWSGLESIKLMNEWLIPVCAPNIVRQGTKWTRGQIPRGIKLLHSVSDSWSMWGGNAEKSKSSSLAVDDAAALVSEAESGRGAALARWSLVHDALTHGRLIALGERIPYRFAYYWVNPKNSNSNLRTFESGTVLKEWLISASKHLE